jgi:hypothetical protein
MRIWRCLVFEYTSMVGYEYMIGIGGGWRTYFGILSFVGVCVCNECHDFY